VSTVKTLLVVLIAIGAIFFALRLAVWQMKRACDFIIGDLKVKKALDPASAVALPYCKDRMFRIGFRDYRPRALKELVKQAIVRGQVDGKYYLREGHRLTGKDDGKAA
jgi:hypothetical protein